MLARVNWEILPGETVEEFVAALLLLERPRGNIITPSRGDRGIDIRIPTADNRFDIYQVKRFTRPLTSNQQTNIENSWREFVDKTFPRLAVRSWTLVTPWDPTNERLEWLENLTSDAGLDEVNWMGRTNHDVRASQNSRLVEYYFGDGRSRTEELMAQALAGARELPDTDGEELLSAIGVRQRALAAALDEIDPFYYYASEIRVGRLDNIEDVDIGLGTVTGTDSEDCIVVAREIDDDHLWVLRVRPRCAESSQLRPISTTISIAAEPGSPEHDALHRLATYGVAPDIPLPARVTSAEGPSGTTPPLGEVLLRIGSAATTRDSGLDLDLELRITPSGRSIELTAIEQTRGLDGRGVRLAGTDRAGAIEVEFLGNNVDHTAELQIVPHDVGGRPPRLVLPTLQAMEELFSGMSSVTLAVAGGPALLPPWNVDLDENFQRQSQTWAALAEALVELQHRTVASLVMPYSVNSSEYKQILDAAAILRGEVLEDEWDGVDMSITDPQAVTTRSGEDEFALMVVRPLTIKYDGRTVTLDDRFVTHTPNARFADPAALSGVQAGDVVRLVPGSNPYITRRLAHWQDFGQAGGN